MITRLLTWKELAILAGLASALLAGSVTVYVMRGEESRESSHTAAVRENVPQPPAKPPEPPELEAPPVVLDAAVPIAPVTPASPALVPPTISDIERVVVEVKGAVIQPGVYELSAGARIEDALVQAGGPTPDADLADINRAAKLIDAAPLYIPRVTHITYEGGVAANRREATAAELNPPEYTISGWRRASPASAASIPASASALVAGQIAAAVAQTTSDGLVDLNTATREQLKSLPRVGDVTADKIIAYRQQTPFVQVEDLLNIPGIGEKALETLRPLVTVGVRP